VLRLTAAANQFIKQTMGAEMSHNPTVREWLEIHKDLDAYIARGGKLMDLWLADAHFLDEEPLTSLIGRHLGQATCKRLARFFETVGTIAGKNEVGEVLTEVELQQIWHQTAIPRAKAH